MLQLVLDVAIGTKCASYFCDGIQVPADCEPVLVIEVLIKSVLLLWESVA